MTMQQGETATEMERLGNPLTALELVTVEEIEVQPHTDETMPGLVLQLERLRGAWKTTAMVDDAMEEAMMHETQSLPCEDERWLEMMPELVTSEKNVPADS